MVFDFFRSPGHSALEEVEAQLVEMLRDGHTVYVTAMEALFGGGKSKEAKKEVKTTDRGINKMQKEVRRLLMVHASVNENVDLPLVLTYMSVVKDIERAGDYAKNIYDLVKYGEDFSTAPDHDELASYRDAVGQLMLDAADVFEQRDNDAAQKLVSKADGFLDIYEDHVRMAYESDGPAAVAVSRALYYRWLKRITAHTMNLMTSLVMPVDQLDYYDEDPNDRL